MDIDNNMLLNTSDENKTLVVYANLYDQALDYICHSGLRLTPAYDKIYGLWFVPKTSAHDVDCKVLASRTDEQSHLEITLGMYLKDPVLCEYAQELDRTIPGMISATDESHEAHVTFVTIGTIKEPKLARIFNDSKTGISLVRDSFTLELVGTGEDLACSDEIHCYLRAMFKVTIPFCTLPRGFSDLYGLPPYGVI